MEIRDARCFDRCYFVCVTGVDTYKTNATIKSINIPDNRVRMETDDGIIVWGTPSIDTFWRKPEAPPKPRREVERIVDGYVMSSSVNFVDGFADATIRIFGNLSPRQIHMPVRVSWTETE